MKNVVLVIGWLVLLCGCGGMPDTLVGGGYDEAKMEAAIERAKDEVDSFIKVMKKGGGTDFSVKAPVVDGENTEHFWLTDIEYADGQFTANSRERSGTIRAWSRTLRSVKNGRSRNPRSRTGCT